MVWAIFETGQLLEHSLGDCALAGGLGAVDDYVSARCYTRL